MEIKLITQMKLPLDVIKDWYACVKNYGPQGVISSFQKKTPQGYKDVCLVSKKVGDRWEYSIELNRNLMQEEVEAIIDGFDFNGDYAVESSSDEVDSISMSNDNYDHICRTLAKYRHEKWVRDRVQDGWRYGPTMSLNNKTSPLLRPWHELSDEHKAVDFEEPEHLIKMLADNGYCVVSKHELEGIKALLKM